MFIKNFCSSISPVLADAIRRSNIFNRSQFKCLLLNYFTYTNYFRRTPLILSYRNMAGHAKWQNIKYVKAEKDRLKNLLCSKYIRLVTAAIREKGPDPKANNKLANVLEEAKKNNVPATTLENALKRAVNKKLKPGTIEILGPGGCFVIVDYETDNICDMRHTLKMLCKKYSFNLLSGEGRWRAAYEQKGIIRVTSQLNGEIPNEENILEAAIEASAEDVQKREDENDGIVFEFLSAPNDLHAVKKELEKNYSIQEAYIGYIPISKVSLSDEDMLLADKFLSELEDFPDISRLFENIE